MIEAIQETDHGRQVYIRLKEMILSGELKPGEKSPQEKIAAMLWVSRMPLHKAFPMLEDEKSECKINSDHSPLLENCMGGDGAVKGCFLSIPKLKIK